MRPSCGTRFSAMSSRAMTLTRDTSIGAMRGGRLSASRITPSTRKRTRSADSKASMCTSEAPSRAASAIMPLIRRITGASSWLSSRSAVAGMSSTSASSPPSRAKSSTLPALSRVASA